MYYLKYVIKDSDQSIVIATTRPETIFADSAIVVHPDDDRYKKLKGKVAIIPGTDREIPILEDSYVDISTGSGAMKVTPYHDINDYEIGKRLNLDVQSTMNLDGTMNELAHKYVGLDRFIARKQLITDLKDADLVVKIEEHIHNVGHSERTNVIIEQIVSEQ